MELILYSPRGDDNRVQLALSRLHVSEGTRLHVFGKDLTKRQIVRPSFGAAGEASSDIEIYPWSHLVSWPFGILLETYREYGRSGPVVMVEAEYFCNHTFDFKRFIDRADGQDLFTVGGRFEMQNETMTLAFPTWEVAYVSRALFGNPEFASFVFARSQTRSVVARLHMQREFALQFLATAKIAALVEGASVTAFDPIAAGEVNLLNLQK